MNPHEQYFSMAMCYIEIGKIASKKNWILNSLPNWIPIGRVSQYSQVGEFQNATAYQLFHAIELFLKYAILTRNSRCWGHDVTDLYQKYKELYPSAEFHFEHPFDFSNYEASPENTVV